jgi:hypothetical protein
LPICHSYWNDCHEKSVGGFSARAMRLLMFWHGQRIISRLVRQGSALRMLFSRRAIIVSIPQLRWRAKAWPLLFPPRLAVTDSVNLSGNEFPPKESTMRTYPSYRRPKLPPRLCSCKVQASAIDRRLSSRVDVPSALWYQPTSNLVGEDKP